MSNVVADCLSLPAPGRCIQPDEDRNFSPSTSIQVSLQQVLRNRDAALQHQPEKRSQHQHEQQNEKLVGVGRPLHAQRFSKEMMDKLKAGKDLVWTTDIDVELPIKLAQTGPAAIPPQTLVEFFADCVRRFGQEPALLFEPHHASSSSDNDSKSPSSRNDDGGSTTGSSADNSSGAAGAGAQKDDGGAQLVCCAKGSNSVSSSPPSYVPNLVPGWWGYTWNGYWADCCFFAKSLLHLGLPPLSRVAVMGNNSPAWAVAFHGTIFSGGIAVGVYTTNNEDACHYVVEHSQCSIAVVDTLENARKMLSVRDRQLQQQQQKGKKLLPGGCRVLQQIVVYRDPVPATLAVKGVVVGFDDFLALGRGVRDSDLSARMEAQKPGCCCSIVYTSGTTGNPKGVMLSHDNLTWTASLVSQVIYLTREDRIVSLLPLSHVAAQLVDLVCPLIMGTAVFFCRPDALRGTLLQTLLKVRPTWFVGVPRIWEKMEQKLKEVGAKGGTLKRKLSSAAKDMGYTGAVALLEGRQPPWGFSAVNKLLLHQVRRALGFDRCNAWASCAAPIDPDTQKYFLSLGMPINSIYGLSESTGPQTFLAPSPGWFKVGSIGHSIPGTDTVIHNPNNEGEGELCFRGRNVFMGYLGDDKATQETIDPQGFLHTGDLGKMDSEGFLFITGRAKEIIITAGGENVAPVLIESLIRQELPIVSNCMVIGDGRKFLSVLICLQTTLDKDGNPTQILAPEVRRVIEPLGSTSQTTVEAAEDRLVNSLVQSALERVNKRVISRAQRVLAWRLLPNDFSLAAGELTATLKLRRKFVLKKYEAIVDQMYVTPHPPCLQKHPPPCKL